MRLTMILAVLFVATTGLRAQDGSVAIHRFWSHSLARTKHYAVYLPPSYGRDPVRRYPVVYYLHGRGDDEYSWIGRAQIDWVMDSLVRVGIPEIILVMTDGDDGWWTTGDSSATRPPCLGNAWTDEPPEVYCTTGTRYDEYVVHELVPHIDSAYRTKAGRQTRGVAGASMGGFGALFLALTHSDIWSAAASHIGVVSPLYVGPRPFSGTATYATSTEQLADYWKPLKPFWDSWVSVFGTTYSNWVDRDPLHLLMRLRVQNSARVPELYLDAARDDSTFADQTRALHAELTALSVSHAFSEWPGGHDWTFLRAHVASSLVWMASQIAK